MRLSDSFFYVIKREECCDKQRFTIRLNDEHEIFKAHFPGEPITPGVCQLQMVVECAEQLLNTVLYVKEVKNIKYISLVRPNENSEYVIELYGIEKEGGVYRLKAAICCGPAVCTKMSVVLSKNEI